MDTNTQSAESLGGSRLKDTVFFARARIFGWLEDCIERQQENTFLWWPIFFAIGISIYFALPFEPPLVASMFGAAIALSTYILLRPRRRISPFWRCLVFILLEISLAALGFTAATYRTHKVHTPIIKDEIRFTPLTGTVNSIEPMEQGNGVRVVLGDLGIEELQEQETPRKIRLRLRQQSDIQIGDRIRVNAGLNPPSFPIYPGGFDFRRHLYFKSIGAVGFMYNAPEIKKHAEPQFQIIEKLRHNIALVLQDSLPQDQAAVAMALVVGQKHALSDEDQTAIRNAGLAHMLAISGLHVGLVAGAIFFFLRLFMACIPALALNYPIKKIAAVLAFCGAVFYMLLAGMTIPTQRAVLMTGIVFLAILMDRSPISLRLVAFSALAVLAISPESLLSVSFQMSFAAVTLLIYFYDATRKFWMRIHNAMNAPKKVAFYFLSVCITTVIASIATAPFALYHFGQVSALGSVANLIAVPLLAFIIMPTALLSLLLMPFGLAELPMKATGIGVDAILQIAHWSADMPYASMHSAAINSLSFSLLICAALWFVLWRGIIGKAMLCIPLIAASILIQSHARMPNALISESHDLFAIHQPEGLYVSTFRSDRFARENWLQYYGLNEDAAIRLDYKGEQAEYKAISCGEEGCRSDLEGAQISYLRTPYALSRECTWADVIILEGRAPSEIRNNQCKNAVIIDKIDTWKNGAHAIYVSPDKSTPITIKTVREGNRKRPWSQD